MYPCKNITVSDCSAARLRCSVCDIMPFAGYMAVPTGSANPAAMETEEDAALLAASTSDSEDGGDHGDDDGDEGLGAFSQDAMRAARRVSIQQLAPPEPSGTESAASPAGANQQPEVVHAKRKGGARNGAAKLKSPRDGSRRQSVASDTTRTDAGIRKKPKRTSVGMLAA